VEQQRKSGVPSVGLTPRTKYRIETIAVVSRLLWERGWAPKNAGNISVDITGSADIRISDIDKYPYRPLESAYPELAGTMLLVTGAGSRMRDVAHQPTKELCIIQIAGDGRGYFFLWGDVTNAALTPTSELPTHLSLHTLLKRQGGTNKAVLHTHPDELIALSMIPEYDDEQKLNDLLFSVHAESVIVNPRGIGLVPYLLTGTVELAAATIASLERHPIVLWKNHGCVAVGRDVQEAFDLVDITNKSAQLFFLCRRAGFEPEGLTPQQIDELKQKFPPGGMPA
jgi:rhamnulose-1-phosphate aldolase